MDCGCTLLTPELKDGDPNILSRNESQELLMPLLFQQIFFLCVCVLNFIFSKIFSFFLKNSYFNFFIVIQLQLSPFPVPPPLLSSAPSNPRAQRQSPPHCPCTWVLCTCSLLSPVISHSHPLWSLSVCSLFPCGSS